MGAHKTGLLTTPLPLLERQRELDALGAVLDGVRRGAGASVVVEGPPGIGKTRLLDVLGARAADEGVEVLRARGGEMEREFAFGLVRQLFEQRVMSSARRERAELLSGAAKLVAPLFGLDVTDRAGASLDTSFAMLHGLYWLCSNLALRGPVLLMIDDAHWTDEPSLQFISYLARRLDEMPVGVAIGSRPNVLEAPLLAELSSLPSTLRVRLAALTPGAVHSLIRCGLDAAADEAFSDTCHQVTGGNPFLVTELLRELAAEHVCGAAREIDRVRSLTPATVAASVLLRLSRLPPEATSLASAVALLGEDVELASAATLSDLGEPSARQFVDVLVDADILRPGEPLEFIHPLVRDSVYTELSGSERAAGHARAARVLFEGRADCERVGTQLMRAPPVGESWALASLRRAGHAARVRGAPAVAMGFLRRALDEPLTDDDRADVLCELGFAQAALEGPTGLDPFREALALTTDPLARAEIALEIARMLAGVFYSKDAADACQQGLDALGGQGGELGSKLEVQLVAAGITDLSSVARATERLGQVRARMGEPWREDKGLLAVTSCLMTAGVAPARRGAELAKEALEDGRLASEHPELVIHANLALLWADELPTATSVCRRAAELARRRGSHIELCWALVHAARAAYRQGSLVEAEADAREVLELLDLHGWEPPKAYALAPLIDVLLERGELDAARDALVGRALDVELGTEWTNSELLCSRARLRIASGLARDGVDDLEECGRRLAAWGPIRNPACIPWRSAAALAMEQLGDHASATELAASEVALAKKFETPRAYGIALCAAGTIEGGEAGLESLRRSVDVLAGSPARLEHARALVELGTRLLRQGHRSDARDPLREGLDLARRCGAVALVERARTELVSAGARPRRDWLRGRDALTATEHRVAQMAAKGMTNRAIAQGLFVSQRTVETHLTHVYQKLGVTSRGELSAALDAAGPPVPRPSPAHD